LQNSKEVREILQSVVSTATVSLKEEQPSEYDDGKNAVPKKYFRLECGVPEKEFSKLAVWKQEASDKVKQFLKEKIFVTKFTPEKKFQTQIDGILAEHSNDIWFENFNSDIVVVCTKKDILNTIEGEIDGIVEKEYIVDPFRIEKFKVLEDEMVIKKLSEDFPNTTFGSDWIRGPKEEVQMAKKIIKEKMEWIITKSIQIDAEEAKVLQMKGGKECFTNALTQMHLTTDYVIKDASGISCLEIPVIEKPGNDRSKVIKGCVSSSVKNVSIDVKEKDINKLISEMGQTFLKNIESKAVVTLDKKLKIVSDTNTIQNTEEEIINFLNDNTTDETTKYSIDVIEFVNRLRSFPDMKAKFTCLSDKHGKLTGVIEFKGLPEEIKEIRSKLDQMIKKLTLSWTLMEKTWLVSVRGDITCHVEDVVQQTMIAETLAVRGIVAAAVNKQTHAAIFLKQSDISHESVDVIVSPTDQNLSTTSGVAKRLIESGKELNNIYLTYIFVSMLLRDIYYYAISVLTSSPTS